MNKHLAPIALSVGLLGLVGGVAATQAFRPAEKPVQRQVQLVEPAAETVTPVPTVTVTQKAPAPVAPKKVAPKPAPVRSTQAPAPAPAPVQRQAVVSEPAPEPQPQPQTPTPDQPASPGSPPPVRWGSDVPTPPTSAK